MNPKLSVIVPVYNTLPYLQTCFDSIKRQKYEPLEVIIVDDGSTDGSAKFCDEYALTDTRFRVIHKENGGQSSARNLGLDNASGDYITFVDSDDALINQPYLYLMKSISGYRSDIICMKCHASKEPFHDLQNSLKTDDVQKLSSEEFFCGLCHQTISDGPWDKIYKKSLFDTVHFQDGVLNEDFLLLINLSLLGATMACTDYVGYYYYLRTGSTSNSGFKKNMIDALYNADYAYSNAPTEACKKAAEGYLLHRILMFLVNMPNGYIKEGNKDYLFAMQRLKEINLSDSDRSKRDKLILRCFLRFPAFSRRVCGWYLSNRN